MQGRQLVPGERRRFVGLALLLIMAGLVWRLVPLGLPVFWLRYGGGAIWGAMVLCLVLSIRPARTGLVAGVIGASVFAAGSEFFRLYHQPMLDAFRETLAGALILGRVFAYGNILAYEVGIIGFALILWLDARDRSALTPASPARSSPPR